MKHTQREWYASPMSENSDKWGVYVNYDSKPDTDCETGEFLECPGMETLIICDNLTEANAKLMASAPKLLKALQSFLEINESKEGFDIKTDMMILAILNGHKAIKKATK